MLRTFVTSLVEAAAILFCAGACLFLASDLVERHSFDTGPLFILILYCLPIGIAALRRHNALLNIMVLNLWLGWTLLGWLVALIWACDTDVEAVSEVAQV